MRALAITALCASLCACSADGASQPMGVGLTRPKLLALDPASTAWTARACIDTSALAAHNRLDALAAPLFAQAGLAAPVVTAGRASSCGWTFRLGNAAPMLADEAQLVWDAGADELDRFAAVTSVDSSSTATTTISATSERGALFGLRSALQFFVDRFDGDGQHVSAGALVDYAGFSRRGIIEGFYGPTYSADERNRLIQLAAFLRQNTYVYALKDADPFTHARWRDPYDDASALALADAVSVANRNLVDFVWAVSPGWYGGPEFQSHSIHYGGDEDFDRLVAKTENVRALGVTRFALFVDDVAPEFAWPDDEARFPSLAAAQAYLMNRWDDYLVASGAPEHLWVVGTKYTSDESNSLSGAGWQDYNATLAAALHPEIRLFWTGPQVYSEQIVAGDLSAIDDVLGRHVTIWDNWPKEPEALRGRAPDLDRHADGLLSNFVMDNDTLGPSAALHDFEQALGTVADYAWQPESYDATYSLARWTPLLDPLLQRLPAR